MVTCSTDKALPQPMSNQWFFETTEEIFEAAADNMDVIDMSLTQPSHRTRYSQYVTI